MFRSEIIKQDKLNPRCKFFFSFEFNYGQNKKDMFRGTQRVYLIYVHKNTFNPYRTNVQNRVSS